MAHNFLEILTLAPKGKNALANEQLLSDLQELADIMISEPGTIDVKFRKSTDAEHPDRLLFAAAWEGIVDHDELDVKGLVPRLLKMLLAHTTPVAAHFMFTDARKIDFDAPVWDCRTFHVREGDRSAFQKEIDASGGVAGGWYAVKKIPPLPEVMPTDPVELKLWEEMMQRAEARQKTPAPNIWMAISTSKCKGIDDFANKVHPYVEKLESGGFGLFVNGKKV